MRTTKTVPMNGAAVRVMAVAVALVAMVTTSARAQDPDRVDKVL